jgi:hypothetical protein
MIAALRTAGAQLKRAERLKKIHESRHRQSLYKATSPDGANRPEYVLERP